jgi:NADH:ubiquinone oxidoreductase subunit F (NADH-binding)/NADH:ubiquinone oxidoreductase subunit E
MSKNKSKRNKFWRPKGRSLDPQARIEIESLLLNELPRRDLLIEFLHLIQDQYGCLRMAHLHALAEWMNIAPVEVYEVATFYHHFDVIENDEQSPAPLTLRVCDSISCMLAGAEQLIEALETGPLSERVRLQRVPCVGRCDTAPVAVVGQQPIPCASPQRIEQAIAAKQHRCPALPAALEDYLKEGGYEFYQACLAGEYSAQEVIQTLEDANLRGLGGAGFPVGQKWRILSEQQMPRWIAVNIDEGEPGTFKDRHELEQQPHALLEGLLIAAWAIESERCVLYVRDEYPAILTSLRVEIEALREWADFSLPEMQLRRGAGAYICGEESAMLESIEGKRGLPRQRPPFIAERGLYGLPTLEHNAETLMWVPEILKNGADWYRNHGAHGRSGLRRYSLSGRVKNPGVYLAPAGTTVRELIEDYAGGMLDGHEFYGYLPGGASGGILPASLGDVPLDFDTLQKYGCFIGSAAVIVFSRHDRARDIAQNAMRFFAHESCGQCTPCRVGTVRASELMGQPVWPIKALEMLSCVMEDASICGLGQAAPNPLRCVVKYFSHEVSDA